MSGHGSHNIRLQEAEFRLLREIIHEHCGIFLPDNVTFLLERRLRPRLKALELEDFRSYYRYVKYTRDGYEELCEIVERITTNETYFFREEYQLKDFIEEIIPDILQEHERDLPVNIWSAGCSSGEEPYTLAMLLNDSGFTNSFDFNILANDISQQVLDKASDGIYREASFRETRPDVMTRYFRREGARFRINENIRRQVTFEQANLIDSSTLVGYQNFDVIFCRNVMIYFARESREQLLQEFLERLRPGGYLLLGHSESLVNLSTGFELIPLKRGIVYRKPLDPSTGSGGDV
ncbi:MAG: protein-glutamate O-methyltransferase CheR [Deltaproteobacteria bacterium]|nr:protein-glutamate O-methyltransferase CheR [Deltaproteobacteria bacterium]MBT6433533.1 protein-glutamate O-methyltransferase CheR [Deltaproteobacteria bacterium]